MLDFVSIQPSTMACENSFILKAWTLQPHRKTIISCHDRNRCHEFASFLWTSKLFDLHADSWFLLKTWRPNETSVKVQNASRHWTVNVGQQTGIYGGGVNLYACSLEKGHKYPYRVNFRTDR